MSQSESKDPIELFPFKMFDRGDVSNEGDFRALPVEATPVPKESVEPSSTVVASTPPPPVIPSEETKKEEEEKEEEKTETVTENANDKNPEQKEQPTPASPALKSISVGKSAQPVPGKI